jgi:DNA-binding CsgD family transcriptional regulator
LINLGKIAEGVALLDEVMVGVTAGEVSPEIVGTIYCSVIEACHEMFDLRRSHEWTSALTDWYTSQPDLVPFRGHCLVRRAEIMALHGAWLDAMDEVQRACECLSEHTAQGAVAAALYQRADLHRLRGEFAKAEEAYRHAGQLSRRPQPGLAQLRLAQGQLEAAQSTIERVMSETKDRRSRCKALGARAEIALAAGDVETAHAAADELTEIAAYFDAPFPRAVAAQTRGVVLLAEGAADAALAELRVAFDVWRDLDAPYEAARTRVLMARGYRMIGDPDTAQAELDSAREVFQELGAAPDLRHVRELTRGGSQGASGLTGREIQVLKLVATGKTNRTIAEELRISEKTVARHVSNIFTKLDLSSRAAATAYAFQHDLMSTDT